MIKRQKQNPDPIPFYISVCAVDYIILYVQKLHNDMVRNDCAGDHHLFVPGVNDVPKGLLYR